MSQNITYRAQVTMLAPVLEAKNLATKEYVDQMVEGTRWNPVKAASDSNLAASAPDVHSLVALGNGRLPSLDGVTLNVGDRLLLWQQADKSQNGLYTVAEAGDASTPWRLTRSTDADIGDEFQPNKLVYVLPGGALYGDSSFKQVTGTAVALGTSPIEFALNIDPSRVQVETLEITGDGSASEFTVAHTLGTRKVQVQTYDAQGNQTFFAVRILSAGSVKLAAAAPLAEGETFAVVLTGRPE